MPFTVSDFEDLVRLLYEHPEWRERLRAVILPEAVLAPAQLVRDHDEAIRRIEQAVAELAELQRRADERFEAFRAEMQEGNRELRETIRQLREAQHRADEQMAEFREAQRRMDERLAALSESTEQRFLELREAQQRTDERLAALNETTEQRFAEARQHTDEQVASLREWAEQRFAEARKHADEQVASLRDWAEQRFAEARQHTDEQVASLRNWAEQRFERLESRVDNLYSEVGRLTNVIGASLEEEAQASVSTLMRQKGYKAPVEGYPVRLDGVGEIDVVLPVESPEGEKLTVVAESKARLSRRAVIDWANRMASPDFRRRWKEAGVPGPYLVYTYAIRVDPASLDAAREVGIGVMSGRGILVEPREPLPEA